MSHFSFSDILITSTTKRESAVVCFRICQGFGLTIVFLSTLWLSLLYKVCMVGVTLVFGVMGYMLLEVTNNPLTPFDPEPFPLWTGRRLLTWQHWLNLVNKITDTQINKQFKVFFNIFDRRYKLLCLEFNLMSKQNIANYI